MIALLSLFVSLCFCLLELLLEPPKRRGSELTHLVDFFLDQLVDFACAFLDFFGVLLHLLVSLIDARDQRAGLIRDELRDALIEQRPSITHMGFDKLCDGLFSEAIRELGFGGMQGEHMVAVENTPDVHNVVVCTLCSCYPWPVLGLPPVWYKDAPYRSRIVIEPRSVLREFGLDLDENVEIRVWDSSAEMRYVVLPERPAGTETLNESELAALVSRDAMIGVTRVTV